MWKEAVLTQFKALYRYFEERQEKPKNGKRSPADM